MPPVDDVEPRVAGRVENALDVPAVTKDEFALTAQQPTGAITGLPRCNVVGCPGEDVHVSPDLRDVDIVQGGHYHSLHDLKTTLTHTLSLARKARRDNYGEYLLDISAFGLDSLLENPRLAEDLDTFALRLLTPLLEYDAANSSHLTNTFVLAQTLGSAQAVAEQLGVHVNTIRYRLRRAEDLLGTDQTSPKEHAALVLAAFTWQHFHTTEQASS